MTITEDIIQKYKPVKLSPEAGEGRIYICLSGFKFSDKEFDVRAETRNTYITMSSLFENLLQDEPFKMFIV